MPSEERLLSWLARSGSRIGDDCAFLDEGLAVTVDSQREGIHFEKGRSPAALARRALAVNLSDLAACGARPKYAFLALAGPVEFPFQKFLRAFRSACNSHGLELAGGDLSSGLQVEATVTLIGERHARGQFVTRTNARPGDTLWLAGPLGWSRLGLELLRRGAELDPRGRMSRAPTELSLNSKRALAAAKRAVAAHTAPKAQLATGAYLSRRCRAAAIDVSDGMSLDLKRLCRKSSVAVTLDSEALAPSPDFTELAESLGIDPWRAVLSGGEDYSLLFALPKTVRPPGTLRTRRLGTFLGPDTSPATLTLVRGKETKRLSPRGWDHFES